MKRKLNRVLLIDDDEPANFRSEMLTEEASCTGNIQVVARAIYGTDTVITGFYSYGETSPSFNFMKCELRNQTMTITTLSEQ